MGRPVSSESTFRALAHVTRRGVIDLLVKRPSTAGELSGHFKHSKGVMSKHLRILHTAGLIVFEREGTTFTYRLVPGAFDAVQSWMSKLPKGSSSR